MAHEDAKQKADSQYYTIYKDMYGVYHKIVEYEDMDIASLYPKTMFAPRPIEKLRNFCLDNNILVECSYNNGHWVVTFSKAMVPYIVTFDSYTDYIGMGLDMANVIIERLTATYKCPGFKILANSFYGMSSGVRPTGKPFKNGIVKYCKEDVMTSMEIAKFYADFNGAVKNSENQLKRKLFGIEKVIFNKEATVVLWKDKTKTVVKCQDGDNFDKEKGLAMAICKKALGTNASHSNFNDIFKKWITED